MMKLFHKHLFSSWLGSIQRCEEIFVISCFSKLNNLSVFFIFFFRWVLTAVTYELALNPNIQDRLISEIDEIERKLETKPISYDELNKIEYLDMVVMEVLRIHSPAVLIDRLCSKRFHLTDGDKVDVYIEKGDHVWIP